MVDIICLADEAALQSCSEDQLKVLLFKTSSDRRVSYLGHSIFQTIAKKNLLPSQLSLDLLAIALSVIAADTLIQRSVSPDGWTREINLTVSVSDENLWTGLAGLIEQQLRFLTTDIWTLVFKPGGKLLPFYENETKFLKGDAVTLLSGGLDSLVGAIDLSTNGESLLAVSQGYRGDKATQKLFVEKVSGIKQHLRLNHSLENCTGITNDISQRSRSYLFLAYGAMAATCLANYSEANKVSLYVNENGYISINPPLTRGRVGSLSTRTTHPEFLGLFQEMLDAIGLNVSIATPYAFITKGEMLSSCADQDLLKELASISTSCGVAGRIFRTGLNVHCGKCLPCLVRRAAFSHWHPSTDTTHYNNVVLKESSHENVRDVRFAALTKNNRGVNRWLGASLVSGQISDQAAYKDVVVRGLDEIDRFLSGENVS